MKEKILCFVIKIETIHPLRETQNSQDMVETSFLEIYLVYKGAYLKLLGSLL